MYEYFNHNILSNMFRPLLRHLQVGRFHPFIGHEGP